MKRDKRLKLGFLASLIIVVLGSMGYALFNNHRLFVPIAGFVASLYIGSVLLFFKQPHETNALPSPGLLLLAIVTAFPAVLYTTFAGPKHEPLNFLVQFMIIGCFPWIFRYAARVIFFEFKCEVKEAFR